MSEMCEWGGRWRAGRVYGGCVDGMQTCDGWVSDVRVCGRVSGGGSARMHLIIDCGLGDSFLASGYNTFFGLWRSRNICDRNSQISQV